MTRQDVRTVVSIPQERGKSAFSGTFAELRMGARRPSGRPGARWLRVDRKPLSTEPGPHTGHTSPTGRNGPPVAARALSLAPSGGAPVRHAVPDPVALRRVRGSSRVGRTVVDAA